MSVGLLVKIKITLKQIRPFLLNLVPNNVKKKINLSYLSLPFFCQSQPTLSSFKTADLNSQNPQFKAL